MDCSLIRHLVRELRFMQDIGLIVRRLQSINRVLLNESIRSDAMGNSAQGVLFLQIGSLGIGFAQPAMTMCLRGKATAVVARQSLVHSSSKHSHSHNYSLLSKQGVEGVRQPLSQVPYNVDIYINTSITF